MNISNLLLLLRKVWTPSQTSTPAVPPAGHNQLYFKSDDKLYTQTSGGAEAEVVKGSDSRLTDARTIDSGAETVGKIPSADGAGGVTWADQAGGDSEIIAFDGVASTFEFASALPGDDYLITLLLPTDVTLAIVLQVSLDGGSSWQTTGYLGRCNRLNPSANNSNGTGLVIGYGVAYNNPSQWQGVLSLSPNEAALNGVGGASSVGFINSSIIKGLASKPDKLRIVASTGVFASDGQITLARVK